MITSRTTPRPEAPYNRNHHERGGERQQHRGDRPGDEDRGGAAGRSERTAELLLRHRTQDHGDHGRRERDVMPPHDIPRQTDRVQQAEVE